MDENEGTPGIIDPQILVELARTKMPFGKYQGRVLCDLPEPYLVWFSRKGFPAGKLGMLLAALYEIKLNGLEYLLKPMKEKKPGR
ncbi:MAG: DUF3820 family protein [Dehalococcoidales bacterium]|nr:DUF3820 family protein [Dehalococcoidales bacterium]